MRYFLNILGNKKLKQRALKEKTKEIIILDRTSK